MKVQINPAATVNAVLIDGESYVKGETFTASKKTVENFSRKGIPILVPAQDLPETGAEVSTPESDEDVDGMSQEDN